MTRYITFFLERHQFRILRVCIGILFLWFGGLKFFPGLSPAEGLASTTVEILTFHLFPEWLIMPSLATLEVGLGLLLVFSKEFRLTFWLLLFHMACTIMPLFILTEVTFKSFPFQLTMEGQYIVKNIVIISAAFVLVFQRKSNRIHN
ncbi:MAG: doxx family protein [Roseivirga sp.]|uniref:DoxX family membrane protein n=1 Tax=Roseivirga sp. TaxID=1964215 RepID=UPI001B088F74|nr:DoxX family membrane protein [Roseivirga sp.]MBO6661440.1 doxx family protein [Roseivirga sp.]MBO6760097.1 doxx family protein [Roseivirga sp.]MBO6908576.1 doxx family protein [Roseivirga sp.]